MNSKQIDCILMLAQTLNFNRAAENLYITPRFSTVPGKAPPSPRQDSNSVWFLEICGMN